MPLFIVRNDITHMRVDAIVNAANSTLLGGGGVDGAIHRAAGPELLAECRTLGGCNTGEAKATGAYRLPAKYVIHTVGPVWRGGGRGERELLVSCYENSLRIAEELGCQSIAFPLISAGVYGYPKQEAFGVAEETIKRHLEQSDITAYIVLFERDALSAVKGKYGDIAAYIDDNYVGAHIDDPELIYARTEWAKQTVLAQQSPPNMPAESAKPRPKPKLKKPNGQTTLADAAEHHTHFSQTFPGYFDSEASICDAKPAPAPKEDYCAADSFSGSAAADEEDDLGQILKTLDESFSQMLLRKIDEKGITDAQCYKRANVDRKLFSKIRSTPGYRPSKQTAIAFAVALELPLRETRELLMKAGFALSHSSRFDVIIEYFIKKGEYDIYSINDALFAYDQPLLG